MTSTEARLREAVLAAAQRWRRVDEAEASWRQAAGGWSSKEVLGHLIDSAHNNHGRFLRAQECDHLDFEGYEQDAWVARQRYSEAAWRDLLELWRGYNLHLARVIAAIPVEVRDRPRTRHSLERIAWRRPPSDRPATLGWFLDDYVGHLEHHLARIDELLAAAPAATRRLERSVDLPLAPERAFGLLVTPSDVRVWWSAASVIVQPQPGGAWAATWGGSEDRPDYATCATIEVLDPPRRLRLVDYRYTALTGPLPFAADITTEFTLAPLAGGSRLTVVQDGFPIGPEADGFLAGCDVGWRDTLAALRRHAQARA